MNSVYRIHTYLKFDSEQYLEQNDLIIQNVYTVKYIEAILYMFQNVTDKISIHTAPDLN